jgi:hypothetical protein
MSYPVPPPSYGSTSPTKNDHNRDEVRDPLLGGTSTAASGAYYHQPAFGDVPDDFKVRLNILQSQASSNQGSLVWNDGF